MKIKFYSNFLLSLTLLACSWANASLITISFDDAISNYTPTPGVIQDVTDEFSSLGIVFQDALVPSLGATLGRCGPGDGPVALFGHGNDYPGCGDTTPNLNILFVDPSNSNNQAFTSMFSVYNFDGLIKMTAFDVNNVELGSVQTNSGLLSLAGIGNISKINLLSLDQDSTTLDTISFESVTTIPTDVPEPSTLAIFALGMIGLASRRFKKQS
jgi:hypothetical protein